MVAVGEAHLEGRICRGISEASHGLVFRHFPWILVVFLPIFDSGTFHA